jgi:hypothetical protein
MKYQKLISEIYKGFPRQVGLPNRLDVNNYNELEDIIKTWNKKKRIWIALYKYSYTNTSDFIIDKLWLDFDQDPYANVMVLHTWLVQHDYRHFIIFSGNGFHVYILTNKKELKNNTIALRNSQQFIINETKVNVDKQVIGDIARVVGLPGTMNVKENTNRWIIFVTEEDLEKGEDFIKEKAKFEQIGEFKIYGTKNFPIEDFDNGVPEYDVINLNYENLNKQIEEDKLLKILKPCVANILLMLKEQEHSYTERFYVILSLKEAGYGEQDIENILQRFMKKEKFNHCVKNERQLKYLFRKEILPPGCETLKLKGYCPLNKNKNCKFI